MGTEVLYADGSTSQFHEGGGASHDGDLAIMRLSLLTAKSALDIYIKSEGKWQLTRNGAQLAIQNVLEPLTGKVYKRSMNGKREALQDCIDIIWAIENNAVVWENADV